MILKYAFLELRSSLQASQNSLPFRRHKLSPGDCLILSLRLMFFGSDEPLSIYFPLVGFNTSSRETEALCMTLPEELEVFEDPFDEEDTIFYLGSQSTR